MLSSPNFSLVSSDSSVRFWSVGGSSDAPVGATPDFGISSALSSVSAPGRGALKWGDLVAPATPLPTPWDAEGWTTWQAEVQRRRKEIRARKAPEQEMDALFLEEKTEATRRLQSEPRAGEVGAFEGAAYEARGYFRPQADCIMFSRDAVPFCAVCRRSLERMLDLYSGP